MNGSASTRSPTESQRISSHSRANAKTRSTVGYVRRFQCTDRINLGMLRTLSVSAPRLGKDSLSARHHAVTFLCEYPADCSLFVSEISFAAAPTSRLTTLPIVKHQTLVTSSGTKNFNLHRSMLSTTSGSSSLVLLSKVRLPNDLGIQFRGIDLRKDISLS